MAVAILLVGGFGTRLMPLTKNTPKPMLTVAGLPVTEHQIAMAKAAGIKEVSVVVKGVGSGRESAIRAFSSFGVEVTSIIDKTPVPHNGPKARKPRHI